MLFGLAGGLLGLLLSVVAIRAALRLLPESMPRIDAISIDATVVMLALLLALATGGLCSLAPAFVALKTGLIESLKEASQTGTSGPSHAWLRSALVVTEISIALVLMTVSGAFLRSLHKMEAVAPASTLSMCSWPAINCRSANTRPILLSTRSTGKLSTGWLANPGSSR